MPNRRNRRSCASPRSRTCQVRRSSSRKRTASSRNRDFRQKASPSGAPPPLCPASPGATSTSTWARSRRECSTSSRERTTSGSFSRESGTTPQGVPTRGCWPSASCVESGRLRVPADLRGLRVGSERSSVNFYIISTLLASAGLTLDDIKASHIPTRLEPEAFQRDLLDVATSSEPWMTRIIEGGSGVVWRADSRHRPRLPVPLHAVRTEPAS